MGLKICYLCQRFRPMIFWKVCTNEEYVSPYWIVRHGDSSDDIDAQLSKIEDNGEEEYRSDTSIAKQKQWSRIEREWVALKEEKVPFTSGKKKEAVSGMRVTIVPKNQSHPSHEVEVCRRKEVSKAKVTLVPFFDNRADALRRVLARDRLVNIVILPNVNSS